jgi:hypothetical protein
MARPRKTPRVELVPVDVLDRLSYIDTVRIQRFKKLPPWLLRELLESVRPPLGDAKRRVIPSHIKLADGRRVNLLTIHQPSFRTFDILEAFDDGVMVTTDTGQGFRVVEVNVALDLLVGSRPDAALLTRFIVARLLKNGRPQVPWSYKSGDEWTWTGIPSYCTEGLRIGTAYVSYESARGVRVAVYGDRPTKARASVPCAHIEWRVRGAEELRRHNVADLEGLRTLDHRAFWAQRLRMYLPPSISKLAAAIAKAPSRRYPSPHRPLAPARCATTLLLAHTDKGGNVNVHDLLLALQELEERYGERPLRRFTQQGHQWMLPSRENALWDDIWAEVVANRGTIDREEDSRTSRQITVQCAAPRPRWPLPLFEFRLVAPRVAAE